MSSQKPQAGATTVSGTNNEDDVRRIVGEMLVRDGHVDALTLERSRRVLQKLGADNSLFQVLLKLNQIDEMRFLASVRKCQPDLPIGALLVELGKITRLQLKQALQLQASEQNWQKLGELLIARRMLRESDVTQVLAAQLGFDSAEPEIGDCDPALLDKVSLKICQRYDFLPLCLEDTQTRVAFADPMNQEARTEAARTLETGIIPVMASASSIETALAALARRRQPRAQGDARNAEEDSASGRANLILRQAVDEGASDIHIEPLRDSVRVRFRIDGILREHAVLPIAELGTLVSRLKIMAGADIAERRRHQDGRLEFENPETGAIADLRVSFYVTVNGEAVVMRVLNQNNRILELAKIGMAPPMLERFTRSALEAPSGVIIITGPTGSGKTSTLYSCVNHLNDETTSIITAEDPVEFQVDGISQCSVNPKLGRTFDESLRHIVRQDPDIIVLGEIRDAPSAESAIQAALTGHKVLTTFHTEDSIGGLLRLMNMNIEAFLISSTVVCVVAQRLIRRVCGACARPVEADPLDVQLLGWKPEDAAGAKLMEGEGCSKCHYSGFKGRVAVFEVLVLSEAVREAILERKTSAQIRRISVETSGLVTLLEDGLSKAARGETTLREIRRTLPRLNKPRSLQEIRRLTGKAS